MKRGLTPKRAQHVARARAPCPKAQLAIFRILFIRLCVRYSRFGDIIIKQLGGFIFKTAIKL